ncbi:MAG: hypothetical protein KDD35_08415, partial [Bdellovibrionales bacterium]|nr:hypothetical protein [Bdellovibrionales bacterium]
MTRDKNFQTDLKPIFLLSLCLFQFGCAGFGKQLKSFLGGQGAASSTEVVKPNHVKYSDNSHLPTSIRRQYRRTTKKSLSEESQLDNKAGSLWVMEGQGSYLFSQNIIRMIGDPMPIRIEGEPRDQLQSKVGVIRKLLAKLEARNFPPVALRNPASSPGAGAAAPARGVAPEAAKTAEV